MRLIINIVIGFALYAYGFSNQGPSPEVITKVTTQIGGMAVSYATDVVMEAYTKVNEKDSAAN